jgi:hypothetical protein
VMGRGFQMVQGGVTPGSERRVTGRTSKRLDALDLAMLAISDQSVDGSVSDAEVRALVVGTGETLGIYPFGSTPSAFDLAPGAY